MKRKELCCCGRIKKHLPYCPLAEIGDPCDLERARKEIKKLVNKKLCSCALINGHWLNCPSKNQYQFIGGEIEKGLEIDFDSLAKMLNEMVETVSKENANPSRKRKRIFVAPVIKRRKKKAAD